MGRTANGKAVRSQVKGVSTRRRGRIVGLSLYLSSLKLQAKAKEVLTAAWIARGKLEEMGVTGWEGSDSGTGRYDDQMQETRAVKLTVLEY